MLVVLFFPIAMDRKLFGMLNLLLERISHTEAMDDSGRNLLHIAVDVNHIDMVKLLLEKGMYIEAKDKNAQTALHIAVLKDHINMVSLLLDKGADIEAMDKSNQTPIDYTKGSIKTILNKRKRLLSNIDEKGNTVLHRAIISNRKKDIQNALIYIGNGVALDTQNKYGNTLLHLAIMNRLVHVSKALIYKGVDLTIENNVQQNVIDCAEKTNMNAIIKNLVEQYQLSKEERLVFSHESTERRQVS